MIKVDPSKFVHNVKRMKPDMQVETTQPNIGNISWNDPSKESEMDKRRKGIFPARKFNKNKDKKPSLTHEELIKKLESFEKKRLVPDDLEIVPSSCDVNKLNEDKHRTDSDSGDSSEGLSNRTRGTKRKTSVDEHVAHNANEDIFTSLLSNPGSPTRKHTNSVNSPHKQTETLKTVSSISPDKKSKMEIVNKTETKSTKDKKRTSIEKQHCDKDNVKCLKKSEGKQKTTIKQKEAENSSPTKKTKSQPFKGNTELYKDDDSKNKATNDDSLTLDRDKLSLPDNLNNKKTTHNKDSKSELLLPDNLDKKKLTHNTDNKSERVAVNENKTSDWLHYCTMSPDGKSIQMKRMETPVFDQAAIDRLNQEMKDLPQLPDDDSDFGSVASDDTDKILSARKRTQSGNNQSFSTLTAKNVSQRKMLGNRLSFIEYDTVSLLYKDINSK